MENTMRRMAAARAAFVLILLIALVGSACRRNTPPVARPMPPPATDGATTTNRPPAPPEPVAEPVVVPPEPVRDEAVRSGTLDDLNRSAPLKAVFFALDSAEINAPAQAALDENATILRRNPTWAVTIEGHCDERGTAEYNLALGERRAVAARAYLVSLGISADRLRTVSYGKEFPFDPGHDESAYAKNRRAHFVITAQ
jgi:peptidoglycan-associated lipoprotein